MFYRSIYFSGYENTIEPHYLEQPRERKINSSYQKFKLLVNAWGNMAWTEFSLS
jgi:hypothetical protein